MKNSNYIIQVPEPCHEDWNTMSPDPKGKFCHSCSKSVVDFSNKTDTEIREILISHKDQKVCGHFKSSQLNRPLNIRIDLNNLPKNMSSTKTFTIALFMVFGTMLFNCTDLKGQKIKDIEVQTNTSLHFTKGKIKMPVNVTREDTIPERTDTLITIEPETLISGGMRYIETPFQEVPEVITDTIKCSEEPMMMGEIMAPEDLIGTNDSSALKATTDLHDEIITLEAPELSVYPNPSTGEFNIRYNVLKRSDVRLDLFDINGSWLRTLVNIDSQHEGKYIIPVNLSNLPKGIYIFNLINDGKRYTEKLILEK